MQNIKRALIAASVAFAIGFNDADAGKIVYVDGVPYISVGCPINSETGQPIQSQWCNPPQSTGGLSNGSGIGHRGTGGSSGEGGRGPGHLGQPGNSTTPNGPYPGSGSEMQRQKAAYESYHVQLKLVQDYANDCNSIMDQMQNAVTQLLSANKFSDADSGIQNADGYLKYAEKEHAYFFRSIVAEENAPKPFPSYYHPTDRDSPHYRNYEANKRVLEQAQSKIEKMKRDWRIARETYIAADAKSVGKLVGSIVKAHRAQRVETKRISENVNNAKIVQANIVSQNGMTRTELAAPRVTSFLEKEAADYIRSQLDMTEAVADGAVKMAQNGASDTAVKLVTEFASDISNAASNFVSGFGNGLYTAFKTASDAAIAISQDPTVLKNLSANIMKSITDPSRFIKGVKESYQTFVTVMNYGTSNEKGGMLGEFAGNVILGLAGCEVTAASKAALEGVSKALLEVKPVSLGTSLIKEIESAPTLAKEVGDIGKAAQDAGATSQKVVHEWQKKHQITHFESAVDANKRLSYPQPPYKGGSTVIHFKTTADQEFVRVHTNGVHSNPEGAWVVRAGEIRGLTPQQIADKLNLEHLPTHVTDVHIPTDTPMSRGMTNLNQWGTQLDYSMEGQVQYRIESLYQKSWFQNTRSIGVTLE